MHLDDVYDVYDVRRERPGLYSGRRGRFEVVDVPRTAFLMVDGHGDPNTAAAYRRALTALYTASYAVRAAAKDELGRVHVVAPLEGCGPRRTWTPSAPGTRARGTGP